MQVVKDKLFVISAPARSARYRAGSSFNIKVQGVRQNKDTPIIAGIYKDGVQIGRPMYLSLFNYYNGYPLENEEAGLEESGSQPRDVAAELIDKLQEFPQAHKWFTATENVVLDADGNEAVLRETLARAMEGLVGEGPVGSLAEEEVACLLRSMEDLIGGWVASPHMSKLREVNEMQEEDAEKQTPRKQMAVSHELYARAGRSAWRLERTEDSQPEKLDYSDSEDLEAGSAEEEERRNPPPSKKARANPRALSAAFGREGQYGGGRVLRESWQGLPPAGAAATAHPWPAHGGGQVGSPRGQGEAPGIDQVAHPGG